MRMFDCTLKAWVDGIERAWRTTLACRLVLPFHHKLLGELFEDVPFALGPGDLVATLRVRALILVATAPIALQLDSVDGQALPIAANGIFGVVDCELPAGRVPVVLNTSATQAVLTGIIALD